MDVIDAVEYFRTVDDGGLPPARFSVATLVVINKVDRLPVDSREQTLAAIEARVAEVGPAAHVVRTSHARLDPALILDVTSAEDPPDQLPIAALLRAERAAADHEHDHRHAASASVRYDGAIRPGDLVDLLLDPPPGAYRLKGTVRVATGSGFRGYLVNVVGRQVHVAGLRTPPESSALVAIGIQLDAGVARERLEAALVASVEVDRDGLRALERLRHLSA